MNRRESRVPTPAEVAADHVVACTMQAARWPADRLALSILLRQQWALMALAADAAEDHVAGAASAEAGRVARFIAEKPALNLDHLAIKAAALVRAMLDTANEADEGSAQFAIAAGLLADLVATRNPIALPDGAILEIEHDIDAQFWIDEARKISGGGEAADAPATLRAA